MQSEQDQEMTISLEQALAKAHILEQAHKIRDKLLFLFALQYGKRSYLPRFILKSGMDVRGLPPCFLQQVMR
ncbi:MAG: hypothetical protein AAFR58_02245, partial [Cyanobacteria bacterium J06627_28]